MNISWRAAHEPRMLDDPAFPRGAALLDPASVAGVVGLPPGTVPRPVDVYYYPARTLQVVYSVADGRAFSLEAVTEGGATQPRGGTLVPGLDAVLRAFPDDPGMPGLPDVATAMGADAEVLAYLPGRRCVLGTAKLVAKVSTPEAVTRNHARQIALWLAPTRRFHMARPLAVDPPHAVRWERRVPGARIESGLGLDAPDYLAAVVAHELAALHRVHPARGMSLSAKGPEQLLERLRHKTLRTVHRALPSVAPRAEALTSALARAGVPHGRAPVVVHGDFHTANLLVDGDRATLLDLDELGSGDPELDVALFASRLLLVALHTRTWDSRHADAATDVALALPDAYGEARGRPLDGAAYTWYLAACLLARQLKTSIRCLAPELEELADGLLTLAERSLGSRPMASVG